MKRLIFGVAAALLLSAGPAAADGLPSKGYVTTGVGPNWNGFYVGIGLGAGALVGDTALSASNGRGCMGGGGGAFASSEGGCSPEMEVLSSSSGGGYGHSSEVFGANFGGEGLFGTIVVGYDRVIRPGWVAGVFADYDFGSSITSDALYFSSHYKSGNIFSIDYSSAWSLGLRGGILANPGTLIYATGGFTQAEFDATSDFVKFKTPTFTGTFVGVGIETFMRSNWTAKLEYRYTDFGSETIFDKYGTEIVLDPSTHTARLVLSYKLGSHD